MTLTFDSAYFLKQLVNLTSAIPFTLILTLCSLLLGTLIGIMLTFVKLSKNKRLQSIGFAYTTIMRGTPTIVLLFLIYYGLPVLARQLFNKNIYSISINAYVILTFTLYSCSQLSELFRASYLAVERGQTEAALSIGMTRFQAFYRIVLPQATVIAIPNLGNTIVTTIKEMSLAFTIGTMDLLGRAKIILANEYQIHTLEVYAAAGLLYWMICFILEKASSGLEHRLSKHMDAST